MEKRIFYCGNCGDNGCGGCGNDARNEFNAAIKSTIPGPQGKSIVGPPGLDNIVLGSQIANPSTNPPIPGTDTTLGSDVIDALKADGFDLQENETIQTYQDESDLTATKWLIGLSNGILNYIRTFIPRLFTASDAIGKVPTATGTGIGQWTWQFPSTLPSKPQYYTTSTTSNDISLGAKTFTVDAGLNYTPNMVVVATDATNSANLIVGVVISYSTTSLVFTAFSKAGSGTGLTNWKINVGSSPFLPDPTGKSGSVLTTNGVDYFLSQSAIFVAGMTTWTMINDTVTSVGHPMYGWLYCDGSTYTYNPAAPYDPTTNPYLNLVNNIGAGSSDSEFYVSATSFKVPDMRGYGPRGVGGSVYTGAHGLTTLGGKGGEDTHLLTASESGVPAHTHPIKESADASGAITVFSHNRSPDALTLTDAPAVGFDGIVAPNTSASAANPHNNVSNSVAGYWFIKL
jgi:microcystin-dependent protein